jgi:hypothetical protein|tara:strand:+ start:1983 stop:2186 length:204 start_codon:yes stop_codon:yes gene_type:complete
MPKKRGYGKRKRRTTKRRKTTSKRKLTGYTRIKGKYALVFKKGRTLSVGKGRYKSKKTLIAKASKLK